MVEADRVEAGDVAFSLHRRIEEMQELHLEARVGVLQYQGDVAGFGGEEANGGGKIGNGHGDVVEESSHRVILAALRPMHELQLEPSGIREEHRIIPRAVLRIVRRGIENASTHSEQQLVEPLDV